MNEKQANININIKDFFFKWVELTKPFHKLNPQECRILALILFYHYKLSSEITNEKILWKMVFEYDTKLLIAEELNIQIGALENYYTKLRKKKVITNNTITKYYIPSLNKKSKNFKIIFNFNIKHEL